READGDETGSRSGRRVRGGEAARGGECHLLLEHFSEAALDPLVEGHGHGTSGKGGWHLARDHGLARGARERRGEPGRPVVPPPRRAPRVAECLETLERVGEARLRRGLRIERVADDPRAARDPGAEHEGEGCTPVRRTAAAAGEAAALPEMVV